MKTIKIVMSTILVLVILIQTGCSKNNISLDYNFKKGAKYSATYTVNAVTDYTVGGTEMTGEHTLTSVYLYNVSSVDKQGIATINAKFDSLHVKANINDKTKFSYRTIDTGITPLTPIAEWLGDYTIELNVNSEGIINDIKANKSLSDMKEKFGDISNDERKYIWSLLNSSFSEEGLKATFSNLFLLPQKDIKQGETFERSEIYNNTVSSNVYMEYKYEGLEEAKHKLSMTGTITNGKFKKLLVEEMETSPELKGEIKGTVFYETNDLLLQQGSIEQKYSGQIIFDLAGIPEYSKINNQNLSVKTSSDIRIEYKSQKL